METRINRNIFAAVVALAVLVTAVNFFLYWEGIEAEPNVYEGYGGAGVNFESVSGMRFNFSRLGEGDLEYMEGLFFRVLYDNETDQPGVVVTWNETSAMSFERALERSYNFTDTVDTAYVLGEQVNTTVERHVFQYTRFTRMTVNETRLGYVGFWDCNNSDRTVTLMFDSPEGFNETYLFELFNHSVSTLRCHYPGQTPDGPDELDLPFDVNTLINVNLMIILCVGFTFTYMMEGFLNFAHTSYAAIGAMVSFYLTRFLHFNPYDTWPFVALAGGVLGVLLYIGVVKPIRRHGGYQEITLTLTFLVVGYVMPSVLAIFNYWSRYWGGYASRGYNLRYFDFGYRGIPGIAFISTITCILLVVGLRYFLTKNKIGLSLRATSENEDLAATIGINTHRAHCASWFISGALSALAGSIITLHRGMGVGGTDGLIINIMTGSILGGLYSIYGAIIGGLFVALAQDVLKNLLYRIIGLAIETWAGLLPLLFLVVTLTFFPNGITGGDSESVQRLRRWYRRLLERKEKPVTGLL
ncbi:MAG: branched-chain amino acid ABC transporter permease [Candidatus Bathyarchaeota archaeon]|nr:branched-chain amino acid ABC transporter permease [Candidatus Bathyarchaeota archaeon]